MISIVIPVYNSSKYILDTLKSCYNQTYNDFEILVIDDFSTDNTEELIQNEININTKFKIKYYHNITKGVSNARNYGVSLSKGEYIYFLDSDDLLKQDALETLFKYTNKFDIVIGNWVNFEDSVIESNNGFIRNYTEDISDYWLIKPPISFLIKKSEVLWDINLKIWEVNDYVLCNYVNGFKIVILPKIVLLVRQHDSSSRASIMNDHFSVEKTYNIYLYIYNKYNNNHRFNYRLRAEMLKDLVSLIYRLQSNFETIIESDYKYLKYSISYKFYNLLGFAFMFGNRGIKFYYLINKFFGRI